MVQFVMVQSHDNYQSEPMYVCAHLHSDSAMSERLWYTAA
eukprot:CAMPEP_0119103304 /NCGR_PEP_ID=MMETSP1180-20130426/1759_1 /TAXON_ID=3052 ORGANISM="Chlamydomonas cf sp, Strain CCMP681" /NCGR_SAMPLE_ID=MMETSP1180 /ASSEMBLY_ACC=CAM_ASM_000741 /LENGTH=39 /DNA_ID= /DNA_START= /DNA_END= /DNA_ORIENTATION=